MPTTVTLFLKGSLTLFAKKGQTIGTVASLRIPPPRHVLKIKYKVQPPGGVFGRDVSVSGIQDILRLDVQNNANPTITLRDEGASILRRNAPTNRSSYKWLVSLENGELYDTTIGVNRSAFKEVLTFNSGELFAAEPLSYNFLLIQRGSNSDYEDFGYVAVRIGVEFSMTQRVVFMNGGNVVFDSAQAADGTNYQIEIENDAPPASRLVTDANHYYKAVGSGIPWEQRILFASIVEEERLQSMVEQQLRTRLAEAEAAGDESLIVALNKLLSLSPPAGPEAACFPTYVDRTDF